MSQPANPYIWRLGLDDVPEAAAVLSRAFAESPFFITAIPDVATRREHFPPFFGACLRYGCTFGRVFAAGIVPGRIDAVGWWYRFPDAYFDLERTQVAGFDAVDELLGEGSNRIERISRGIDVAMERDVPSPRANLDQIGVDPTVQRRGLGQALVRAICADAAREGLPVALWTDTAANVRFYRSVGFEVTSSGADATHGMPWWGMFRGLG